MKIIFYVLFGIVYTVGYFFLAVMGTGGGHGNFILLLPLLPWLFNFVALFLLTRLETQLMRIYFALMMFVYYGLNLLILSSASEDPDMVTFHYPANFLIPAAWFILGQIIIWAIFFKKCINQKPIDE